MKDLDRLLREAGSATAPDAEATDRITARVTETLERDPALRALLSGVGAPTPEAVAALTRRATARRTRGARLARAGVAALAAAAALALALRAPPPLRMELDGALGDAVQATDALRLAGEGRGQVTGTHDEPLVTWQEGRLEVDLAPGSGSHVRVRTPEAEVQVIGTRFVVTRDVLGTRVAVTRGQVRVQCGVAAAIPLTAGLERTCAPLSAAGLLGRARALRAAGDAAEALDAAREGAEDATGPVRGELLALQVALLLEAGDPAAAGALAATYVAEGHTPRRGEMQALIGP